MTSQLLSHESFKHQLNGRLITFFAEKKKALSWIPDEQIASYIDQVATITLAGGKRIRPYLAYLGYKIAGGREYAGLMDACMALELFHVFALVHDDIIDRADMRHGEKTVHRFVSPGTSYGESQAMLVGDMVHTWAHTLIIAHAKEQHRTLVHERFSRMVEEVIVGQMIDVSFTCCDEVTDARIAEKNRLKTARYSFVHPLQIGAALAGDVSHDRFFESFGTSLGVGFQVQDDLIDIMGTSSGKSLMRDIAERQHTHLTQYVHDYAQSEDRDMLRAWWGCPIDDSKVQSIKDFFERTGAIDHATSVAASYISDARKTLAGSRINPRYRGALESLVALVESRSS